MIALDTNVLVRYLVKDDPQQHNAAASVIGELSVDDPAFIAHVTFAELFWVLRRGYWLASSDVLKAIERLAEADEIVVENESVVRRSVELARTGADFADALIGECASGHGCTTVVTFDQSAANGLGWRLIG